MCPALSRALWVGVTTGALTQGLGTWRVSGREHLSQRPCKLPCEPQHEPRGLGCVSPPKVRALGQVSLAMTAQVSPALTPIHGSDTGGRKLAVMSMPREPAMGPSVHTQGSRAWPHHP